jgi:ABC-type transport system involved in cytochrome c biogenesis permease component
LPVLLLPLLLPLLLATFAQSDQSEEDANHNL